MALWEIHTYLLGRADGKVAVMVIGYVEWVPLGLHLIGGQVRPGEVQ